MKNVLLLLTTLALMLFMSCASKKLVPTSKDSDMYNEAIVDCEQGMICADAYAISGNMQLGRTEAAHLARLGVARAIEQQMLGVVRSYMATANQSVDAKNNTAFAEDVNKSIVNIKLRNCKITKRMTNGKGKFYAVAKISVDDAVEVGVSGVGREFIQAKVIADEKQNMLDKETDFHQKVKEQMTDISGETIKTTNTPKPNETKTDDVTNEKVK